MQQAQTFDFAAQLLHGGRRTADDVGHGTIMRLRLGLRKGHPKTPSAGLLGEARHSVFRWMDRASA